MQWKGQQIQQVAHVMGSWNVLECLGHVGLLASGFLQGPPIAGLEYFPRNSACSAGYIAWPFAPQVVNIKRLTDTSQVAPSYQTVRDAYCVRGHYEIPC